MNEKEQQQDENLARLIQAGFSWAVRPDRATRQETLRRLKELQQAEYQTRAGTASIQWSKNAPAPNRICPNGSEYHRNKHGRNSLISLIIRNRWGFGLGAAAVGAAIIVVLALATPTAQARAAEIMTKGAQAIARLTTIHLRGQLRTAPQDNFGSIEPEGDFCTIELWKQFQPELKWRAEKPGRVVVMDGQQTLLYLKPPSNVAAKRSQPSAQAFDTYWLHEIANLSNTLSNELRHARAQGWKLDLTRETGADGRAKAVVSIMATSGLPDDEYGKDNSLYRADTRRVYRFDTQTERLEAVQIYLVRNASEVQIFDLNQIDYDQPIEPGIWQLDLPADVSWYHPPEVLPDNEKYAAMSAEETVRAFFEACAKEDWLEAAKFYSPLTEHFKEYLGGVEIISLGKAFTSRTYVGAFVPYELKFKTGETKEHNVSVRKDNPAGRWQVDGGL